MSVLFVSSSGSIIMYGALLLFESEFVHIVAISFTSLILTELLMVALTVQTWHWLMIVGELLSLACYIASLVFLHEFIGERTFLHSWTHYFIHTEAGWSWSSAVHWDKKTNIRISFPANWIMLLSCGQPWSSTSAFSSGGVGVLLIFNGSPVYNTQRSAGYKEV